MKKIFTTFLMVSMSLLAMAQQEDQFTQFMHYKMGFNPGYAGSKPGVSIAALVRNQWIGLEGSPQTQLITFDMPLYSQKVGIGASIMRQTIGLTERYTAEGVYSYRIRNVGRGHLAIGLQGSIRLLRVNFTDAIATQPIEMDEAIPGDIQSKYVPNFGVGLYYDSPSFYIGLSAPRLLTNNIDLSNGGATISREVRHFYLMGGLLFNVSENLKIQPQLLLKYVTGAPFDGDANVTMIFSDKFHAGFSYRLGGSKRSGIGESISLLLGTSVTENIFFGLAYDYTLSELRAYNSGSVEGVFRYLIGGKEDEGAYENPRFFR